MSTDNRYSDEQLQAFVDDEIDITDRAEIMEAIRHDDELACQVCELLQIKDTVRLAYLEPERVAPGQAEVEMAVQYDGVSFQSEVTGWYEQSGQRYDLNLRASGQSTTQRGIDGQEAATEYDFTGTISGVTSFGFFVALDAYFVEGLVHVSGLRDDYYHFREREHALVGERGGRRFRLGDPVRVQVVRVDKEARHIDFALFEGRRKRSN